ncbi:MAG: outer membrane protein [Beijerinckiaceae bacterium]
MKRLVASLALCASPLSVLAADLPVRTAAPAPAPVFVVAPVWTGFYVGVHGGYATKFKGNLSVDAFNDKNTTNDNPNDEAYGFASRSYKGGDGFFGGAHLGYNWQAGQFVFGLVTDISFGDQSLKTQNVAVYTDVTGGQEFFDSYATGQGKVEWFGTTRIRLGYDAGSFMPFLTGGVAYGGVKAYGSTLQDGSLGQGPNGHFCNVTPNNGQPCVTGPISAKYSNSDTKVGWTLGAGFDYAFTPNFIVNFTYLYVDLGDVTASSDFFISNAAYSNGNRIAESFTRNKVDANFHTVRIGLSYKFGGPVAAPVVARY